MTRLFLLVLLATATLGSNAWAQSAYGKAERRDPIFLRFSEMADRYWVNTDTMTASHKVVAVPMPRQCAFLYADSYSKGQMSEREVQEVALSNCNRRLAELGPLGENYGVTCQCQVVISDESYVVPQELDARRLLWSDFDLLSRRSRQRCTAERGDALRRADRARPFGHLLGRQRRAASRSAKAPSRMRAPTNGKFSLSCFGGKFSGSGSYQSKIGTPNDHIIARGQTSRGLPIVMVIGLPAQLAAGTYGGI